ncbi:MAG: hypothetical protein Q4F27_00450, partial [Desulfovibrionaceae bacterium]|nr:hypothetical protein [Desulfovibrionaceae bacterium]
MRWFIIDELLPDDSARLTAHLDELEMGSGMPGLYWLPLPEALLSPVQQAHAQSCGPHVMALEIEENA